MSKITRILASWICLPSLLLLFFADGISQDNSGILFTADDMLAIVSFARGSKPKISPDGKLITYGTVDVSDENNIMARRPTGFLWIVSTKKGKPKLLLEKGIRGEMPVWSADGSNLLYLERGRLLSVSLDGSEIKLFFDKEGMFFNMPSFSPNGSQLVCQIPDKRFRETRTESLTSQIYSIDRPTLDLYLISLENKSILNLTEIIDGSISQPLWSSDGRTIYFKAIDSETYDESLIGFALNNNKLEMYAQGKESYELVGATSDHLAVIIQTATKPRDLWIINTKNGERKQLTKLNPQLRKFRFGSPELFRFQSAGGERLAGLLYKPMDQKAGDKVPVITYVYEKLTPGIHRFIARNQMFLNHGYALLLPDVKIKVGAPGTSFVDCVVPAVDAVKAMDFTNGKFGIWGNSFGGYATSFIITQTNIFSCAVSQGTPPELIRSWASGRDRDANNIVTGQARMGVNPFEDLARYIAQSPFFHLDKVTTPALIMHGVKDQTILFGEGEMMFYALRQLGKEATFVIYNQGDHSLSRHSRLDTLDVNRRLLEWFDKYLKN